MKGNEMKNLESLDFDGLHETLRNQIIKYCVSRVTHDSAGHLLDDADKIELDLYLQDLLKDTRIDFIDDVMFKLAYLAVTKDGDIVETTTRTCVDDDEQGE